MISLIIVDCQNDFISGSLAVKTGKQAVENIKEFIKSNKKDIDNIIFTVDWHPYNHCSFKKNNGQWPIHCVQYTPGACIEPKLLKLVQSLNIPYYICPKGYVEELEQYGAFSDITTTQDFLGRRYYFDLAPVDCNNKIVVCGIAGDYCVKETLKNIINACINPYIYLDGIASIDDGTTIRNFIIENNLENYEKSSSNKS